MRAGYGVFFPQADVKAGASRQLFSLQQFGLTMPSNTFNLFTVSGTVTYALDIWGGERRQVEALRAVVDAQRFTLTSAYLMLSSNLLDALIARAAYRAQVEALRDTIARREGAGEDCRGAGARRRRPVRERRDRGEPARPDRGDLPRRRLDQTSDLLAMLTGRCRRSGKTPASSSTTSRCARELPLSLPSALVRQRPNVLISEAQLHQSSAQIGVATAAMLPSITLSGTYGNNPVQSPGGLFGPNTSFWNIGAGLTAPLFHGGTLSYQRKAAVDAYEQALAQYRSTVLSAFQQVADVLRALEHDADAVSSQDEAVRTSGDAVRLLQANYAAGVATYAQLLVADAQYLTARIGYVGAVAGRLQDTVALYAALGGGWWNAPGKG